MSELTRLSYDLLAREAAWKTLPIVVIDVTSGEILHISPEAAEIFDYDETELIGSPIELLLPVEKRKAHVLHRQRIEVPNQRLTGPQRLVQGKRKKGDIFPAYVGITTIGYEGRKVGVAFIVDLSKAGKMY